MNPIIFFSLLFFIISFVAIYFSADLFMDNIKDIIKESKLQPYMVGALFLGVDIEETIASASASAFHLSTVAIGNVFGNTIIALTIPFMVPAFMKEIKIKEPPKSFLVSLLSLAGVYLVVAHVFHGASVAFFVSGFIGFGIYFLLQYKNIKSTSTRSHLKGGHAGSRGNDTTVDETKVNDKNQREDKDVIASVKDVPENGGLVCERKHKKFFYIVISAIIIFIAAYILGESIDGLIDDLGISQHLIGYIIVAFGTNVEEFLMIAQSIKKNVPEVGTGAIIMKCIWNMSVTYGISMLIYPVVPLYSSFHGNLLLLLITIIYFSIIIKHKKIGKIETLGLTLLFISYLLFNVFIPT
ncbi:MAG: hypothetical protein ACTSYS_14245 [Promethearchaeota archaeon]